MSLIWYQQGYKDGLESTPFRQAQVYQQSPDYRIGYTNGAMTKQALDNYNEAKDSNREKDGQRGTSVHKPENPNPTLD